jgi:hypothetical protein
MISAAALCAAEIWHDLACGSAMADDNTAELMALAPQIESAVKDNLFPSIGHLDPCAPGATMFDATNACNVAVGIGAMEFATTLAHSIFIGRCSGHSVTTGSHDLLIGDYTSMPDGAVGFVNIANKLCFWRDSGDRVACPAPEPECGAGISPDELESTNKDH